MVRKISTKINDKDLARKGIAKLGQVYMPIKIRRYNDLEVYSDIQKQKILSPKALKKSKPMTAQLKEVVLKDFPELKPIIEENKGIVLITEYDTTSEEHIKSMEEWQSLVNDIDIISNFDFDYKDEEGLTLWEGWGIERGNYVEFARKLRNITITQEDLALFKSELDKIKAGEKTIADLELELEDYKNDNK